MAFAGLRGTDDNKLSFGERPQNFREMILWLNPNGEAPLYSLMALMGKEKTDDPRINWYEEILDSTRLTVNGPLTSVATAFVVDAGALELVVGDLLLVEKTETSTYDNEIVQVATITSDTAFTVTRGAAGTTAAAIADNAFLTRIGSAWEEGADSPNVSRKNPTALHNYTQIFKTAVGVTRTMDQTRLRTGDAYKNDKKRKAFRHSAEIEWALIFGQRFEDLTGSQPKRYMGGLRSFIPAANTFIHTTAPSLDTVTDQIETVFDYDGQGAGNERLVLAGRQALTNLNKLIKNDSSTRINYDGIVDMFGMKVHQFVTPSGVLRIKTHPLMSRHGRFNKSMLILNPTGLKWRHMLDTKFMDNIQNNDTDARKGQWITEGALEVQHSETMAYVGNLIAA